MLNIVHLKNWIVTATSQLSVTVVALDPDGNGCLQVDDATDLDTIMGKQYDPDATQFNDVPA